MPLHIKCPHINNYAFFNLFMWSICRTSAWEYAIEVLSQKKKKSTPIRIIQFFFSLQLIRIGQTVLGTDILNDYAGIGTSMAVRLC